MAYLKSKFKKDILLILPYSEVFWYNLEQGWVKHKSKGKLVLFMATNDSFSLHDFIDCFNLHINHAALLHSNERCK